MGVAGRAGGATEHCTGTATLTGKVRGRTRTLAARRFDLTGGQSASYTLAVGRSLLQRVGSRANRRRGIHRARLESLVTAGSVDDRTRSVTFRA